MVALWKSENKLPFCNAWELIENSKRRNLQFGTRWESKTQVGKFSAASLTEKRKLIQYWDTQKKYQCKIPALGTKIPELGVQWDL